MTLAVVLWEDRHAEPAVFLFTHTADAIERATAIAHRYGSDRDVEETFTPPGGFESKCVYFARYSNEGDCVSVLEREVDAELDTGVIG